ncbi:MAG: hypothetical protein AUJ57_08340 [Zetaproteobacteria bacterium CG1_02_53_45]|nr:MAG: hypothetical protein AUJ57_08340 [Zetaproteobacteria bacterium CG1_02_53_45]
MKNRYSALLLLCAASLISGCFMLQTTVHQPKPKAKPRSEASALHLPAHPLQQRESMALSYATEPAVDLIIGQTGIFFYQLPQNCWQNGPHYAGPWKRATDARSS